MGTSNLPFFVEFGPPGVGVLLPVTKQRWHEWVQLTCFFLLEVWVPETFSFLPPFQKCSRENANEEWVVPTTAIQPATLSSLNLKIYGDVGLGRSDNMLLAPLPILEDARSIARTGYWDYSDLYANRMPILILRLIVAQTKNTALFLYLNVPALTSLSSVFSWKVSQLPLPNVVGAFFTSYYDPIPSHTYPSIASSKHVGMCFMSVSTTTSLQALLGVGGSLIHHCPSRA